MRANLTHARVHLGLRMAAPGLFLSALGLGLGFLGFLFLKISRRILGVALGVNNNGTGADRWNTHAKATEQPPDKIWRHFLAKVWNHILAKKWSTF